MPLIPIAVALTGALVYGLGGSPKLQEIGRILFFAGVLWLVYDLSGRDLP
jgi:hypothetical protein